METGNYGIDLEIESRAQDILNTLGTDIDTFLKNVLEKVATHEISTNEIANIVKPKKAKRPFEELIGKYKGKIWIADDFDAPLECMKEYME